MARSSPKSLRERPAALENDEIRMTNFETNPNSENPEARQQHQSRGFRLRAWGCFRHWSFVIGNLLLLLPVCSGCAHLPPTSAANAESEIRAVLEAQVRAWNAGDLRGFMEGYAHSDRTRFQSGGDVSLGWQTVFDRYQKRYGDRASMGALKFNDVEVSVFMPDTALAYGRWRLERAQDAPSGLFTLLFRRAPAGWRIVHDHTSAAD
jgi:ketosteroid isomerase-like protein